MTRPGMSDGRVFTNYTSSCQMNSGIQQANKINSDAEYRKWLQQNAIKIMQQKVIKDK